MKKIIFLFLFFLSACTAPQLQTFDVPLPNNRVALNVKNIDVISHTQKFDRAPYIDAQMPMTADAVLQKWIGQNFIASNPYDDVDLYVYINKAYMTQEKQKNDSFFTLDNTIYKLTYNINFEFVKKGMVLYSIVVEGYETSSLPWRHTLNKKEETWQKMMQKMVEKTNRKVLEEVPENLRIYF